MLNWEIVQDQALSKAVLDQTMRMKDTLKVLSDKNDEAFQQQIRETTGLISLKNRLQNAR